MKKTNVLFLILSMVFVLTSCSLTKNPVKSQDFSSKLTNLGFTIIDVSEQYEGNITKSLIATDPTENYQIEFYEFTTHEITKGVFANNEDAFDHFGSGTSASASGVNWAYRAKSDGKSYGHISYIGTTFVWVIAPDEYRQPIRDAMKELGY